jgi:PleD family two-component response regulator
LRSAALSSMRMAAGSGPRIGLRAGRSFAFLSRDMHPHPRWRRLKTTQTPLSMASPAPTIIVIEDETSMRRLLKTILVAQGYLVVEAETGRRGLVEAGTRKPDLVILDLGLPDMDGA